MPLLWVLHWLADMNIQCIKALTYAVKCAETLSRSRGGGAALGPAELELWRRVAGGFYLPTAKWRDGRTIILPFDGANFSSYQTCKSHRRPSD